MGVRSVSCPLSLGCLIGKVCYHIASALVIELPTTDGQRSAVFLHILQYDVEYAKSTLRNKLLMNRNKYSGSVAYKKSIMRPFYLREFFKYLRQSKSPSDERNGRLLAFARNILIVALEKSGLILKSWIDSEKADIVEP